MGKKLAIKGHSTRGKEIIELLEMMGGINKNMLSAHIGDVLNPHVYFLDPDSSDNRIVWNYLLGLEWDSRASDMMIFTLEEFLKKYPFKVGDKVFLYDNITEGCVTEMKWDEDKGTVKYCVYTSAEYWCDVKELLKWNPIDFLDNKHCNEKQVNGMKNVLTELLNHIKNTPKEELEREFNELEEWSHVGPTVEEFMTFCECVNKKPKYPTTYAECKEMLPENVYYGYSIFMTLQKLIICRDVYWKIAGEEMGLDKPWKPDWNEETNKFTISNKCNKIYLNNTAWYAEVLSFPTAEMRDAFYENFKKEIEQCKELL